MADRRIGAALRALVLEDDLPADPLGGEEESVLMNLNRQRIFQHLCFFPCSSLAQVASALRMSGPTVQWHVAKLARARYLRSLPPPRPHPAPAQRGGRGRHGGRAPPGLAPRRDRALRRDHGRAVPALLPGGPHRRDRGLRPPEAPRLPRPAPRAPGARAAPAERGPLA